MKTDRVIQLKDVAPDLVIYCDPYDAYYILDDWKPGIASKNYQTVYIPYGYLLIATLKFYTYPIYKNAWKVFVESTHHIQIAEKELGRQLNHFMPLGSPKFDPYYSDKGFSLDKKKRKHSKKTIIFAPHWSVSKIENRASSWYGNFMEHFDHFIKLVKNHPEIHWVMKPHPLLFPQITHTYGQRELEKILSTIKTTKNLFLYTGHDYIPLFQQSDGMILDSNSFVGEYMPSGHPILFMQKKQDLKLNSFGEKIYQGCYFGKRKEDMDKFVQDVILNGKDPLKKKRIEIVKKYIMLDEKNSPSTNIFHYLSSQL